MSLVHICSLFVVLAVFGVGGSSDVSVTSFSAPVCTSAKLDLLLQQYANYPFYYVRLRIDCFESNDRGYSNIDVLTLYTNGSDISPLYFFDDKLIEYVQYRPIMNIPDTAILKMMFNDKKDTISVGIFDGTVYFGNHFFDPITNVCANVNTSSSAHACCSTFQNVNYEIANEFCSTFSVRSEVRLAIDNSTVAVFGANFTFQQDKIAANVIEFSAQNNYNYRFGLLHSNTYVNGTAAGATLSIPFGTEDTLFDVQMSLNNDVPAYTNRIVSLTQRKRNWYWGKNTVLTRANPCIQWQEFAGNNPDDAKAYTNVCCSEFSKNPNTVPLSSTAVPWNTASPGTAGSCAEYRSITTVNWNGFNLNHLNVKYVFDGSVLNVEMQNFTSSKPGQENAQLEAYSTDTFTQTCSTASNSGSVKCSWRLSETSKYEFQLRTATYANGFNMFLGVEQNQQFTSPSMKPCHLETNALIGGTGNKTVAVTEICCISTPNGPWPGTTQLDAPLIWPF